MLSFWKYMTLEKMKNILIKLVHNSEEDLLEYGIHIESFSFEIPKELKKLFSYALKFENFMYAYYDLVIPIDSKEGFNFTSIFYSKSYSFKPRKNPSEFSFIRELEKKIHQPKLHASLRFDAYISDSSLNQNYIKKIAPLAKIFTETNKVELIIYELNFEIKYKVYYI
jgi:hypothetical protein